MCFAKNGPHSLSQFNMKFPKFLGSVALGVLKLIDEIILKNTEIIDRYMGFETCNYK